MIFSKWEFNLHKPGTDVENLLILVQLNLYNTRSLCYIAKIILPYFMSKLTPTANTCGNKNSASQLTSAIFTFLYNNTSSMPF